ncbi:MAG TPA: radical SAM protein [Candidatus Aenigmarchaeota archaeon]|nr:radical SAM protein [Candidatus Aenigmarchaeota archaeon]
MEPKFKIQWHLTNKCTNNCKFCYIKNKKIKELPKEEIFEIIDSLDNSTKKLNLKPIRIYFSGGDILLRKDIFKILEYCSKKNIDIGILGNPNLLTSRIVKKLSNLISRYQISIDGLEKTHDYFRGTGSFKMSIKALKKLKKEKILTIVQSTVSKININELPSLFKYLSDRKLADVYSFARLVPEGKGKSFKKELPTPKQYREFLLRMFYVYQEIIKEDKEIYLSEKDPLWALLFYELGLINPKKIQYCIGGCGIGKQLVIDVDGSVYECRRYPIKIGEMPKQKLEEIFSSNQHKYHIQINRIEGCKDCSLLYYCRGCRAIAYYTSNNYFCKDPQCWKTS